MNRDEFIKKLLECYQREPRAVRDFFCGLDLSFDNNTIKYWYNILAERIAKIPDIEQITVDTKFSTTQQAQISDFLSPLPSCTIGTYFGKEWLEWTYHASSSKKKKEEHRAGLRRLYHINEANLERVRLADWQLMTKSTELGEIDFCRFKRTYDLLQQFPKERVSKESLDELLWNEKISKPKKRKQETGFSVLHIYPSQNDPTGYIDNEYMKREFGEGYTIHLDATFGMILTYEGKPIAVSSFAVIAPKTLLIRQLQGVLTNKEKESKEEKFTHGGIIGTYRWTDFFVRYTAEIARRNGYTGIEIETAKNNIYLRKADEQKKSESALKIGKKIYDQTAERLAFTREGEYRNWKRDIEGL